MKLKFAAFSFISVLALGGLTAVAIPATSDAQADGGAVDSAAAADIIWPAPPR